MHAEQEVTAATQPLHLVVVPHTHWDREWYQPFQEFRIRLVRLLDRLLDILESDAGLAHFHLDGQTIVLEDYLEIRPQNAPRLRRLIRSGRIAIGPWYNLPDEFLVSGESLMRNLQIGHAVAAQFGNATKIGYLPDEFGHTAQMPQILKGCGIDSAVVWRGVGADVTDTLFSWEGPDGSAVLTVYLPLSGYSNGRNLPEDAAELRAHLSTIVAEQAPFRRIPTLLVMNGTDHQEAAATLPATLAAASSDLEGTTYEIASLARFIERARDQAQNLQTHRGELRSSLRTNITPGVTSVRVRLKQRDFDNSSRLEHYAEPLATWADLLAGEPALSPFLAWAWKILIQNHPHDSITGCSVDQVHRDMEARSDQVQLVVSQILSQALKIVTQHLDTSSAAPAAALVVYNPNGSAPCVVGADLTLGAAPPYVLVDSAGNEIALHVEGGASEVLLDADLPPADVRPHVLGIQGREFLGMVINDISVQRSDSKLQVAVTLDRTERGRLDVQKLRNEWLAQLDDPTLHSVAVQARTGSPARITFCAPALNPHGFNVFALQRRSALLPSPFVAGERELQNHFYRVAVNDDGSLSITDKQSGIQLARCNWFVDEGDRGDEYNFDPVEGQVVAAPAAAPRIRIEASNAVVATLTLELDYELPAALEADRETRSAQRLRGPITTVVRLYGAVKRVDFETSVENSAADHRLRVHFQTPLKVDSAFMEQAFSTVERSLSLEPPSPFERPVGTAPQKTFTCIDDGTTGVALFNRGIPEVEVSRLAAGTEIALTLIRAVGWLSRGDLRYRHGPAGPGLETPEAQSLGRHRFEYALTTFAGDWQAAGIVAQAHAFAYPPIATVSDTHDGALAADASLTQCDNPHVVFSALTGAKRHGVFLARWYNSSALPQTANLTIPPALRVRAVDLLENPTRNRIRRVGGQRWRVQLRPFEIVTLQVTTRPLQSPTT